MSTAALNYVSPEEYLRLERMAEFRSEYLDGRVIAMTGAGWRHSCIVSNLDRAIGHRLRGSRCRLATQDQRVKLSGPGYVYPDVVGVCGSPRVAAKQPDTLLNPVLIIEVLSPSTEKYDRGEKLAKYRALESLSEIVLVTQFPIMVERYVRTGDVWAYSKHVDREGTLPLASVRCDVPIHEIYEDIPDTTSGEQTS